MNIVKAIKLAKKRKMGFVRKGSYEHRIGCYLYPTNITIYKIALYLPARDEYIRFWLNLKRYLVKHIVLMS